MPRKLRQLKADLKREGYYLDHTTGDHTIWMHPLVPGHVNIAGKDGDDAHPVSRESSARSRTCGTGGTEAAKRTTAMNEHAPYSMMIQWSEDDQAYLVLLPEWADRIIGGPAVTHGASYEEAVRRGHEALDALIASAQKHNEPLPQPRTYAHV